MFFPPYLPCWAQCIDRYRFLKNVYSRKPCGTFDTICDLLHCVAQSHLFFGTVSSVVYLHCPSGCLIGAVQEAERTFCHRYRGGCACQGHETLHTNALRSTSDPETQEQK